MRMKIMGNKATKTTITNSKSLAKLDNQQINQRKKNVVEEKNNLLLKNQNKYFFTHKRNFFYI